MNAGGIVAAIISVVTVFEQLGVDYYLGGSVVSGMTFLVYSKYGKSA
jgi:hypothetical protein